MTLLDAKEITQVEIACDCGASFKFPVPLKNELIDEMICLGCKRPMWLEKSSEVRIRLAAFLKALEDWRSFPQDEKHCLSLRFVLSGEV
jgi:RNase P subunit RPR2